MELEILNALASLGALGLITFLFIRGDLMSRANVEEFVKLILEGRNNHIVSLEETMGEKLDEVVEVLKDIKKDGAMKGG